MNTSTPFDSQYASRPSTKLQYASFGVVKSGASLVMFPYDNAPFQPVPLRRLRNGMSPLPLNGGLLPRESWVRTENSIALNPRATVSSTNSL